MHPEPTNPSAPAPANADEGVPVVSTTTLPQPIQRLPQAARKQYSACDACRSRKVKCFRVPNEPKCVTCRTKNLPCTSVYVTSASHSNSKRSTKRPRTSSTTTPASSSSTPSTSSTNPLTRTAERRGSSPLTGAVEDLIGFLFEPDGVDAKVTESRKRLAASKELQMELAADLVETYFAVVHIRLPLLDPSAFRSRFYQPEADGPPPECQIVVVIAWGGKFSENPLIVQDRSETLALSGRSHSQIATQLCRRAQEVLERAKVHRVASIEHVSAALLMELLLPQHANAADRFKSFWITTAVRHLLELQINKRSTVLAIKDSQERGATVLVWWIATQVDAIGSACFRRKPILSEDDYDVDLLSISPAVSDDSPDSSDAVDRYVIWYRAQDALLRAARKLCLTLWTPRCESSEIPASALRELLDVFAGWRMEHLARVGVPPVWPQSWDFVQAVQACATDACFHALLVSIADAVEDYGIAASYPSNDSMGRPPSTPETEHLRTRALEEGLHAALRISALSVLLRSNNYLRLDPNFLRYPLSASGLFLARRGRSEATHVVAGLRQYALSYEDAAAHANEIESLLAAQKTQQPQPHPQPQPEPHVPAPVQRHHRSASTPSEVLFSALGEDFCRSSTTTSSQQAFNPLNPATTTTTASPTQPFAPDLAGHATAGFHHSPYMQHSHSFPATPQQHPQPFHSSPHLHVPPQHPPQQHPQPQQPQQQKFAMPGFPYF